MANTTTSKLPCEVFAELLREALGEQSSKEMTAAEVAAVAVTSVRAAKLMRMLSHSSVPGFRSQEKTAADGSTVYCISKA